MADDEPGDEPVGTYAGRDGERGERHPDFRPGNLYGVKAGAASARLISERALEVHAELVEFAPQLRDRNSLLLTEDLVRTEAIAQMLFDSIVEDSAKLKRGIAAIPTTRIQRFIEATGRKGRIIDSMGLSPTAKAKMHKEASDAERNKQEIAKTFRSQMEKGAQLHQKAIEEGRFDDADGDDPDAGE